MKRMLISLICIAGLSPALSSAQDLVFSNQTITVQAENLSMESVEFYPFAVTTNSSFQWVDAVEISTNGVFDGGGIVTNDVQVQESVDTISTNLAHWVCNVRFDLPSGHLWQLNNYPVTIERFRTRIAVEVPESAIQTVFPDTYSGLCFVAANGTYKPEGQVKAAFLGVAASVLAGGGE